MVCDREEMGEKEEKRKRRKVSALAPETTVWKEELTSSVRRACESRQMLLRGERDQLIVLGKKAPTTRSLECGTASQVPESTLLALPCPLSP
jgi:hypothetical protein